jgi:alpha-tubulin suppressor-like RCC1 family protein
MKPRYLWFGILVTGLTLFISPVVSAATPNKPLIAAGGGHTLAILKDGRLWAWGRNNYGQLGLGFADSSPHINPVRVGTGYVAVAPGSIHTLGLQADGSLWACGYNYYGELGLGDTSQRLSPTQVKRFNAPRVVVIPLN